MEKRLAFELPIRCRRTERVRSDSPADWPAARHGQEESLAVRSASNAAECIALLAPRLMRNASPSYELAAASNYDTRGLEIEGLAYSMRAGGAAESPCLHLTCRKSWLRSICSHSRLIIVGSHAIGNGSVGETMKCGGARIPIGEV